MERLINALTELVTRPGKAGETPIPRGDLRADLSAAPASVKALAEALVTHCYNVELGEFSMYYFDSTGNVINSLEPVIDGSCEDADIDQQEVRDSGGPGGAAYDPARTLQIGEDGGGMSVLGVSWSGDKLGLVVVEIDDPVEENLLTHFTTPAEFFEFLREKNEGVDDELPDVAALEAALGYAPTEAAGDGQARYSRLGAWDGTLPPHPYARAQAHFDQRQSVFQAGPTAAGRYAVARRFRATGKRVPTTISIIGNAGAEHTIKWPVPRDVYGMCLVPDAELALLCAGVPGPLVELDLQTGVERERLPDVLWSCGFLDRDHLAVLAKGEVRVYRWDATELGKPVATLAVDSPNIFVGHGRIFCKTRETTPAVRVLAWDGSALSEEGVVPVDVKLFAVHAAAKDQGQMLLATVNTDGEARWLVYR
ncbi:MAG TPA: hypothetical protein VML75_15275 [Kofleriaceae bacterium]|nr:hypothetical protein [Kofleriaceae bacterium]